MSIVTEREEREEEGKDPREGEAIPLFMNADDYPIASNNITKEKKEAVESTKREILTELLDSGKQMTALLFANVMT